MINLRLRQWLAAITLLANGSLPLYGADIASSVSTVATASGASTEPAISSDGRYVVFASTARLAGSDKNTISDVYLKDRRTGALRRLSDDRGGDQPAISATGQSVAYRSLDDPPQVRLVDLLNPGEPRIVSYPFPSGHSFRTATNPQISPEGRFVSFILNPVPARNDAKTIQLCVNDTFAADRLNAGSFELTEQLQPSSITEAAVDRIAVSYFIVTTDALDGGDTNGRPDIYRSFKNTSFVSRVTNSDAGLLEDGNVWDLALSADATRLFFISDRQIKTTDQDGRATIYVAETGTSFAVPTPIDTDVEPVALSKQATVDGRYLTFLGKNDNGAVGAYVLEVSTGKVLPVGPSSLALAGAPVMSANNQAIALSTATSLLGWDGNGAPDIYVFPNPFRDGVIDPPTVTLNSPEDESVADASNAVVVSATGSSGGGMFYTGVQIDGAEAVAAQSTASTAKILDAGNYSVRAVAINSANVAAVSVAASLRVRPSAGEIAITDLVSVKSARKGDGSTSFSGVLKIDNNSDGDRGPIRVVLLETPGPAKWEFFGDAGLVPVPDENLLGVFTRESLRADSVAAIPFKSTFSPATTIGANGFQGLAWAVTARLEELVGETWVKRDSIKVLDILPELDDSTPGPNGGVPISGVDPDAGNFNPDVLQEISILGPKKIAAGTKTTLKAIAVFDAGNKACMPKWQITNGAQFASISPTGVLSTVPSGSPQLVTVKASFLGKSATKNILSNPVSPKISIRASQGFAVEAGASGEFRVTRTPVIAVPVTVNYAVSGTAVPGTDFQALSGTVTIPSGQAAATIDVTPINDAIFTGRRTVTLSITPSTEYRLSSAKAATVFIDDDEPFPNGQPDAVIQASIGPAVGEFQVDDSPNALDPPLEVASAQTVRTKPRTFTVEAVNRGTASAVFTAKGATSFVGFVVTYLFNGGDVTAAVRDGTFTFPSIAPESSETLQVVIQPTADTPPGAVFHCPITIKGANGVDKVEAVLKRTR